MLSSLFGRSMGPSLEKRASAASVTGLSDFVSRNPNAQVRLHQDTPGSMTRNALSQRHKHDEQCCHRNEKNRADGEPRREPQERLSGSDIEVHFGPPNHLFIKVIRQVLPQRSHGR